ncbi:MAG: nuclear transport factor 2 family protein [Sulfuricellaceae bacterium]
MLAAFPKSLTLAALVCLAVLFVAPAHADEAMTGDRLVRQLWGSLHQGNHDGVEAMLAPAFQAVHEGGVRDRAQEIAYLRGMKVNEYSLSNIVATGGDSLYVVSYRLTLKGSLNGRPLVINGAPRLSVFSREGDVWHWTAHANLAGRR